jgi:hypothetical protein
MAEFPLKACWESALSMWIAVGSVVESDWYGQEVGMPGARIHQLINSIGGREPWTHRSSESNPTSAET